MAHNLNFNKKGEASFFSVKEAAWHRLGRVVPEHLNAEEALQAAQLDFDVVKQPLFTTVKENIGGLDLDVTKDVPNNFATVRRDTGEVLGVVGNRYTILQNRDAFKFFDAIVDEGEAIYETAGVLGKGERVWIMAKMPDYIRVGNDDLIQPYVTITNSHDGSSAITAFLTTIRIVCNNTLTAALRGAISKVNIRHTANAEIALKQAHKALGIANLLSKELEDAFNVMSKKQVNSRMLYDFLNDLLPDPEDKKARNVNKAKRERIMEALAIGAGSNMPEARGTAWGIYNAVTYSIDHMTNYRDDSVKLNSLWFGTGADFRQTAFDKVLELCN